MDALKREFRAYEDRVPTRIINELRGLNRLVLDVT